MNYKAVITGDIVRSREMGDLQALLQVLKEAVVEIEKELDTLIKLELYRGDSFQILIDRPEQAIKIAVLLRSKLRSATKSLEGYITDTSLEKLWDARVAVGIGKVNKPAPKVVESTGEAFELSGRQLDKLKGSQDRISFKSSWEDLNHQLEVLAKLTDAIISRWTLNSSEAVYSYLLFGETQQQIAMKLKISQPAVHKRLTIANIDAIDGLLKYLYRTIKKQIHGV